VSAAEQALTAKSVEKDVRNHMPLMRYKRDRQKKRTIDALTAQGTVYHAAQAVGISCQTAYRWQSAPELHVGWLSRSETPLRARTTAHQGASATIMSLALRAAVSIHEEPGAGKLHAGICAVSFNRGDKRTSLC
jgi:hypothetical protein